MGRARGVVESFGAWENIALIQGEREKDSPLISAQSRKRSNWKSY